MDNELHELAKSIVAIQKQAALQTLNYWKPEAENIIVSQSKDIERIEYTLDMLCEVAYDDEVLRIFKRLCRYYYDIDPLATAQHVNTYREMWDNKEDNSDISSK
ncbi:MAG: hypothetical protein H6Q20_1962 [Bacteroidetes bacterium]|jgi:uncharacterized protein (UPF0371 family)|nr:hypothetical protein [Bacteroidota bacterium]